MIIKDDCLVALDKVEPNSVDLVYLDPPFFTQKTHSQSSAGTEYVVNDVWESREYYLQYMKERITKIRSVMKDTASIFLHCDNNAEHHLRFILDEIFGEENFRAEIIWSYRRWTSLKRGLMPSHQKIYHYSKTDSFKFNRIYTDYSPTTNIDQIMQDRERNEHGKTVYKSDEDGNIVMGAEKKGVPLSDVWDVPFLNPKAKERTGYPTQKPIELIERIIKIASDEGDVVLDPFCGSGTTIVAAKLLNRNYIGIDNNEVAINITNERLKNPIKTSSKVLEAGIQSYMNKSDEELNILNLFDCVVVQRNRGIDAILKKYYLGAPVALKIQRRDQSLKDSLALLHEAAQKRKCSFMILVKNDMASPIYPEDATDEVIEQIRHDFYDESFLQDYENVAIINRPDTQLQRLFIDNLEAHQEDYEKLIAEMGLDPIEPKRRGRKPGTKNSVKRERNGLVHHLNADGSIAYTLNAEGVEVNADGSKLTGRGHKRLIEARERDSKMKLLKKLASKNASTRAKVHMAAEVEAMKKAQKDKAAAAAAASAATAPVAAPATKDQPLGQVNQLTVAPRAKAKSAPSSSESQEHQTQSNASVEMPNTLASDEAIATAPLNEVVVNEDGTKEGVDAHVAPLSYNDALLRAGDVNIEIIAKAQARAAQVRASIEKHIVEAVQNDMEKERKSKAKGKNKDTEDKDLAKSAEANVESGANSSVQSNAKAQDAKAQDAKALDAAKGKSKRKVDANNNAATANTINLGSKAEARLDNNKDAMAQALSQSQMPNQMPHPASNANGAQISNMANAAMNPSLGNMMPNGMPNNAMGNMANMAMPNGMPNMPNGMNALPGAMPPNMMNQAYMANGFNPALMQMMPNMAAMAPGYNPYLNQIDPMKATPDEIWATQQAQAHQALLAQQQMMAMMALNNMSPENMNKMLQMQQKMAQMQAMMGAMSQGEGNHDNSEYGVNNMPNAMPNAMGMNPNMAAHMLQQMNPALAQNMPNMGMNPMPNGNMAVNGMNPNMPGFNPMPMNQGAVPTQAVPPQIAPAQIAQAAPGPAAQASAPAVAPSAAPAVPAAPATSVAPVAASPAPKSEETPPKRGRGRPPKYKFDFD